MEKEAGVSVLLSGNYNNFQCHRPVAPGATDEEYLAEFYKAIDLCEAALARKRKLTDAQEIFGQLCQEYLFLKRYFNPDCPESQPYSPPLICGLTDGEKAAWERLQAYETLVSGHKDPWDWQNMLNTNDDEQPF